MELTDFRSQVNAFKTRFMEAVDNPEYTDPDLFHILTLTSGSTKINAQLEVLSTSASDIYEKIVGMTDSNAIHEDFSMTALENETTIGWTYVEGGNPNPISTEFPWYAIVLLVCLVILIIALAIKFAFFGKNDSNSSGRASLSSEPMSSSQRYPFPSGESL